MSPRPYLATTVYKRYRLRQITTQLLWVILALASVISIAITKKVVATSVNNIAPEPLVSFTFDDGLTSTLDKAAPTLAKYGFQGTSYVIPGCVGTKGLCAANTDGDYMDWQQIKQLQHTYSWEIGSHGLTHPSFSTLSAAKQDYELKESKRLLAEQGIDARTFATPYGDYNHKTIAAAAKYYEAHRGFWDKGFNRWPYNDYLLSVQQIQSGISLEQAKRYIDITAAKKQWLILVFHDIKDNPSPNPDDFEYSTASLDTLAAYVKQKNLRVSTVQDGIISSNVNLLSNSSFSQGITHGWSTDTPEYVKIDTGNNGSFPEPKHAVVLRSSDTSAHLFSPKIDVTPAATYMIKSFLNVTKRSGGDIGYYIDEYDGSGTWISGQWKVSEPTAFVETISFPYKPSSLKVRKARLQIYTSPGTGIEAYVDSFAWFPLTR
jgi:peptidoglycan/xylan/chitin deacetylase (PgdA/CDA1 family)